MFFPYQCQACEKKFDGDFPIGKAPREVPCPKCQGISRRTYEGTSIAVSIGGAINRKSTFGEHMKSKNLAAANRQKGRVPPVRLKAWDHGGGDIREV